MKQLIVAAAATLILPTMTFAAELKVLSTQATEDTYRELVPQFEKATGYTVTPFSPVPSTHRSGWQPAKAMTWSSWRARRLTRKSKPARSLPGAGSI